MTLDWIRRYCLSLPEATEQIQWGNDLVFKVAGKIFAVAPVDPGSLVVCFKVTPEEFVDLTERAGIVPAPYLARAKWVALEDAAALSQTEYQRLLRQSYVLVVSKLPKKVRVPLLEKM
ncbi:MAG: MmcQ/YjbR family DNA-binding protein [Acidobacteria bacterium]|nr:MmcQ/YjbR family DNA-binding protein [Acidobacteriota bacterium]